VEAARRLIALALLLTSWAGCSFRTYSNPDDVPDDAKVVPDAPVCTDTSTTCVSPTTLRDCVKDKNAVDTPCPWGCLEATGSHCGKLQPAGGVLSAVDLGKDATLQDGMATIPTGMTGEINTDDGSITNLRAAGMGAISGIEFQIRQVGGREFGVFRVGKLDLEGSWTVKGTRALVIAAQGDVLLHGQLDVRGDCQGGNPGPGGTAGAPDDAAEPGGGNGGSDNNGDTSGGGGGGYGASGGNGGRVGNTGNGPGSGASWGDDVISALVGGGGGGGGGGTGGVGGGGGGAVQIAANGNVAIRLLAAPSGINAGGCGGKGGTDAGGGGGAGGTILIEAPTLELDGTYLVVNGGSGGGGNNTTTSGNGASGSWSASRASAGNASGGGNGDGGQGGAAGTNSRQGQNGHDASTGGGNNHAGGGGGGVGRILVNTKTAADVITKNNAIVSPSFLENGTTSIRSTAVVQ
jgi:hypothetical protein